MIRLQVALNGERVDVTLPASTMLLDFVRSRGLTGTKEGCGVGVCGACTVLVNDEPVSSCLRLAACVDGDDIWTVEGLVEHDPALIDAFVGAQATQCGICTPGQVVSAVALARERERPDNAGICAEDEVIRAFMAGNLCRCTGYVSILDAVKAYLRA